MINILDNTLRDGSYVIDFQFSKSDTFNVTKGLGDLGFKYIEVGHGLGLGAWNNPKCGLAKENDDTYIKTAVQASPDSIISAFFIPGIGSIEDIKLAYENGLKMIRIGININTYQETKEYAEYAKKLGLIVGINLMKSYAVKPYEFSSIVKEIDSWQLADIIYFVDSAGCLFPSEVHEYIDRTKQIITTDLGFHGHNNLTLGIANTLQSIRSGATFVDSCIQSMGRSAGNAQTEILVHALNKLGVDLGIDLYEMYNFSEKVISPLMPRKQGLSPSEIHIGVSKFHSSYMAFVQEASKKYGVDENKLIKEVSEINCLNPTKSLFDQIAKEINENI